MSLEQQLQEQLADATHDVVGGPDLKTAIRAGRRRRTTRSALLGGGAAATVVAASFGVASVVGGGSPGTVVQPDRLAPADAPSATDFVAGTDVDETLQETVASYLPSLAAADDVFPSNWNHDGPIDDAQFANATDWQAYYTVDSAQTFRVIMGYEENPGQGSGIGEVVTGHYETGGVFIFTTTLTAEDGFTVGASELVQAPTLADAKAARVLDKSALAALVQDPAFAFELPASAQD